MAFTQRHLLGLEGIPADEITTLLDTAASFKEISERDIKKVPTLRGKTVINLFYEASTRTRTSFEIAAKRLSADTINVSASSSSASKGETLADTARNLEAMRPDAIVVRHPSSGACHLLARHVSCPIINAGDGCHEHPTQALLDLLTIRERRGDIAGLTVAIVGDILHSRVARSNLHALRALGATVRAGRPADALPRELGRARRRAAHAPRRRRARRRRHHDAAHPARAAGRPTTSRRLDEYSRYFCLTEDVGAAREAARDHPASRADEPRPRDLERGRRRALLGHHGPGDERRRGAHGAALPPRGRATRPEATPTPTLEPAIAARAAARGTGDARERSGCSSRRHASSIRWRGTADAGATCSIEDGRIVAPVAPGDARRGRRRAVYDARGLLGAARPGRHARAPARAGLRVQGDDRDRRRRRRSRAASPSSPAWRTPSR